MVKSVSGDGSAAVPRTPSGTSRAVARNTGSINVLVAVDKPLVREGLLRLLRAMPQVAGCLSEEDPRDVAAQSGSKAVDCLFLDPDSDRVSVLKAAFESSGTRPRVLLVTPRHHVGEGELPCLGCACGMLSESAPESHIRQSLTQLVTCDRRRPDDGPCAHCPLKATVQKPKLPLTQREFDVFLLVGEGAGPSEIAAKLGLSVKTVEYYRGRIKEKLGLEGPAALAYAAISWRQGHWMPALAAR